MDSKNTISLFAVTFFNIEQAENKGFKSGFLFKLTGVGTVTIKKLHFQIINIICKG